MDAINITITGPKASGKTTFAMLFANFLMERGVQVTMDELETKGNGDFLKRLPVVDKTAEVSIKTVDV